MPLLSPDEIRTIATLAMQQGLPRHRPALLSAIAPNFVTSLEVSTVPNTQLWLDLNALNWATRAVGGGIPLQLWLEQAAALIPEAPEVAAVFQAFAARLFALPEPNAAETERVATATVETIQKLSRENATVNAALEEAQGAISDISGQLTLLVTHKRLHDVLHRLQIEGLPVLQTAITRERFSQVAQQPLLAYHVDQLKTVANEARGELENLPEGSRDYSDQENWILKLEGISKTARAAVDDRTFDIANAEIIALRRLIKNNMSRLNVLLTIGLRRLDISELALNLRNFASLALAADDARAIQLREAATRLLLLQEDIQRLIAEHDRWQRFDEDLWGAEDDLMFREETAYNLESFSRVWPGLSADVESLAGEPKAEWYGKAALWAGEFVAKCPMPAIPPLAEGAREDFRFFTRATRTQFREVDLELKGRCNRLAALTRPLQKLAR